ncbi:MAG: tetratricopeptide repeat protein [Polyangiaceae bacterium]|nr:tetratricopeptide repeat protein [Polyangiaceae bacterium]
MSKVGSSGGDLAATSALVNERLARGDAPGAVEAAMAAVAERPDDAEAHTLLGTVYARSGQDQAAEKTFHESIALDPTSYKPHANLALLLKGQGRKQEALDAVTAATKLAPKAAHLHARRGQLERDLGAFHAALDSFREAHTLEPKGTYRDHLARAFFEAGRHEDALDLVRHADPPTKDGVFVAAMVHAAAGRRDALEDAIHALLRLSPTPAMALQLVQPVAAAGLFPEALGLAKSARHSLPTDAEAIVAEATVEEVMRRFDRAVAVYDEGLRAGASSEALYVKWLRACSRMGQHAAFVEASRRGLAAFPRSVRIRTTMALHDTQYDRLEEASRALDEAEAIDPADVEVLCERANLLAAIGANAEARVTFERALRVDPSNERAMSAMLFVALHDESLQPEVFRDLQTRWAERFGVARVTTTRNDGSRDPERRLKVALVSPDLRSHAITKFLLPLLRSYDRARLEVHLYSLVANPDATTDAIRALDLAYHEVHGLTPAAIARRIAADDIDIAIELAGLTSSLTIPALAHAPAGVQATYLGWPATTGVPEIGHRLTDNFADPPGVTDHLCTESLERLTSSAWCFALDDEVAIAERREDAPIVLGSFNRATKLGDGVVRAWARILRRLPDARVVLKGRGLDSPLARARIVAIAEHEGVEPERIRTTGWVANATAHLETWNEIDIALDSYPYAGTTTTCEALWMGVPVVTFAGDSHVSRVGASLLHQVGLVDLVTSDWDAYERAVVALAGDGARRRTLRRTLRERLRGCVLGDGSAFAREFESVLRSMWKRHVASAPAATPVAARLGHREPRRYVPAALDDRETFVALEQGVERDAETDFLLGFIERRSSDGPVVVAEGGPGVLAHVLASAARRNGAEFTVLERDEARHRLGAASVARLHLASVSIRPDAIAATDVERASVLEVRAATVPTVLALGVGDRTLLRVRFDDAEQGARAIKTLRAAGLEVYRAVPAIGALRLVSDEQLCPLSRSVFAVRPRFSFGSLEVVRHPVASIDIASPIAAFREARSATLPLQRRAQLLEAAFHRSAAALDDTDVGGRLTYARLAIETGRRALVAEALSPLPAVEDTARGEFLSCSRDGDGQAPAWCRLRSIEAIVRWGARSSYDEPERHQALLVEYFQRGGDDAEMNRRLGLLFTLRGRSVTLT